MTSAEQVTTQAQQSVISWSEQKVDVFAVRKVWRLENLILRKGRRTLDDLNALPECLRHC